MTYTSPSARDESCLAFEAVGMASWVDVGICRVSWCKGGVSREHYCATSVLVTTLGFYLL